MGFIAKFKTTVMPFHPRNAYYLRLSTNITIPLFLYLDERHTDWMSDIVLQRVLADLRPLIIPKFQAEKDVHVGPGLAPGANKRGTVEVHRGETYQFAYFFRKTEPHTVLRKSRYFLTAGPPSEVVPGPASPPPTDQNSDSGKEPSRLRASAGQRKRKRPVSKGETKRRFGEDEWSAEESEGDVDDATPTPREPPPARKQRRIITDACHEDDAEGVGRDVMNYPPEMDGGPSGYPAADDDSDVWGADGPQDLSPSMANIELTVEEEERKPKPLLKLKYQSFPISGHCLCVVVEPWPPLHAETKLHSAGLKTSLQHGNLKSLLPSHESVVAGQRAKTPLFFSEYDGAPAEAPFAREAIVLSGSLFHDTTSRAQHNDYSDGDLINFSQTLNAAGHMHALTAEDDDDIDGAVLFGDADEVRELS